MKEDPVASQQPDSAPTIFPPSLIRIIREQYQLPWDGIHGVSHWARVLENGLRLAPLTGAAWKHRVVGREPTCLIPPLWIVRQNHASRNGVAKIVCGFSKRNQISFCHSQLSS